MNNENILVIEDEAQIRKLLDITLQSNGYKVTNRPTGSEGLLAAASHQPDLVILDIGLPDESGHVILQKLREWYTKPVIILSVQNDEADIIQALDNGANDYLVKPFRTGELLARIRSSLRSSSITTSNPVIKYQTLEVDLSARTVKLKGEILKLTATQYRLLALFARNEGRVLTYHYLLRDVWGPDFVDQVQYLRVFVAQLRKKIETNADRPEFIITESGIGYRFAGH